jgi:L-fuconolactonase
VHAYERDRPDRLRKEPPHPWAPDPNLVSDVLEVFDEHAVNIGLQVTPLMMGYDNEYSVEVARAYPTRIAVLARFDPLQRDVREAVRRLRDTPGVVGIRHTFFRAQEDEILGGDALDPFWAAVSEYQVPVCVYAPGGLVHLIRALERHPDCPLILDHLCVAVHPGAHDPFRGIELLAEFAAFDNVCAKISGICELSRQDFPFADVHHYLDRARVAFGAERLFWGSDYPNVLKKCTYSDSLRYVQESSVFSVDELALVLGDAAWKQLRLSRVLDAKTSS